MKEGQKRQKNTWEKPLHGKMNQYEQSTYEDKNRKYILKV